MKRKQYDKDYKIQAVKLYREVGTSKAAKELGISTNTLHGWIVAARDGRLDMGEGNHVPEEALSFNEQVKILPNTLRN